MKQQAFEDKYTEEWNHFEAMLVYLEGKRNSSNHSAGAKLNDAQDVSGFPESYRRLCHYLALTKDRQYSTRLFEKLNNLVLRGHQQLYRRKSNLKSAVIEFIVSGFPNTVREQWVFCAVATAVFVLPGLLLWTLTIIYPELIYSFMDPDQINDFESMYDPAKRAIGRVRDADSDFAMFGHYIQNNIGIGFQTFASGMLFGVGSLFFLIYNGLFFGVISGHIVNLDYSETFFPFVVGHGSFELTAIVLSGAAGLKLGYALIAPGRYTRAQSIKHAANSAIKIVYGVILMLLIAAFIEAFWSSSTLVSINIKYMVGAVLWTLIFFYFFWMGRRRGV